MTIRQLIKEVTGKGLERFCKDTGFNFYTLKSWSLKETSEASRNPEWASTILDLAKTLDVPVDKILNAIAER